MSRYGRRLVAATALVVTAAVVGSCSQRGSGSTPRAAAPSGAITEEERAGTLRIEELIQRRAPDVLIRRQGGRLLVQIRGQNTLRGDSQALIVIDGIVQESTDALLALVPSDVHRVEVLKDGSAASYGVRGAGGVLLITTRRP